MAVFDNKTENRRAIEALRCGVPNQDAVRAMGSSQPVLEKLFATQLNAAKEGVASGKQAAGLLIDGGFGTGKSHLLERFQHIALEQNFVCSKISISKETPLHDLAKVYRAAVEAATVSNRRGTAIPEIAVSLKVDSPAYADFVKWVNQPDVPLSAYFAATLYLYEYATGDEEIRDRIVRFWSGEQLNVSELRRWLRDIGEAATYKIDRVKARDLALQRYFFLPRLIIAAGYAGWVLLIDEAELIGYYSLRQRARSYGEVARLLGELEDFHVPGLFSVLSFSDDFESAVIEARNDEEKIANKLDSSGFEPDQLVGAQARRGIQVIRANRKSLARPTPEMMRETYRRLRSVYASAYDGWQPPENYRDPDPTARMRQNIKRWITEWDLVRLYPGYQPQIETAEIGPSYTEEPELESSSDAASEGADKPV